MPLAGSRFNMQSLPSHCCQTTRQILEVGGWGVQRPQIPRGMMRGSGQQASQEIAGAVRGGVDGDVHDTVRDVLVVAAGLR